MTISPEALGIGLLFERVPDAVFVTDIETGRILLWNPGAERIFGYPADEAVGMPLVALIPEAMREGHRGRMAELRRRVSEGLPDVIPPFESLAHRGDGTMVAVEVSLSPVAHPTATAGLVLVIARDVTERVRTRERLEESELRYRTLIEALNEVVFQTDGEGRCTFVNPAWTAITGFAIEETLQQNFLNFVHPDDRERHLALCGPLLTGEAEFCRHEVRYRTRSGGFVWMEAFIRLVRDEVGRITGSTGTLTDISARHASEAAIAQKNQELTEQRNFMRELLTNLPAGMAYYGPDLRIRLANAEYARIFHRPLEDTIGKHVLDIFGDPGHVLEDILKRIFETGQAINSFNLSGTYSYNGETYSGVWDVTRNPVFDENGQVTGVVVLMLDVKARAEIERLQQEQIDQLQQVDRMKDQFLSILSHELRTPLNAILGFASILDDELVGALSPDQHRYMHKILGGTEVLLALINDLLDMSRIQAGKFQLKPEPMTFQQVALHAMGHLTALAEQKRQTLWLDVPQDLPSLVADEQRVEQVLMNLVGNAIKFTPEGGRIEVRAAMADAGFRCEVTDTGIGIPAEHVERLFQPFTQVDGSNTRSVGGTGLGLSIAKALVEAHGGTIGVESTPGKGSTFWFTLPQTE